QAADGARTHDAHTHRPNIGPRRRTPRVRGEMTDTIAGLLAGHSAGPALITVDGDSIDGAALRTAVERLADRFVRAGLGPADRIAIVLPNGPEMALALLAAMSVGCAAPLNPKYRQDEFPFYPPDP